MTNEFAADQYFTTLRSMLLKGWLTQEHRDELQGKVNQWAGQAEGSETVEYSTLSVTLA